MSKRTPIRGFRNRVIHDYFGVDLQIVWKITSDQIPGLISEIDKAIRKHQTVIPIASTSQVIVPLQQKIFDNFTRELILQNLKNLVKSNFYVRNEDHLQEMAKW